MTRQEQVAVWREQGLTYAQIGQRLGVSGERARQIGHGADYCQRRNQYQQRWRANDEYRRQHAEYERAWRQRRRRVRAMPPRTGRPLTPLVPVVPTVVEPLVPFEVRLKAIEQRIKAYTERLERERVERRKDQPR